MNANWDLLLLEFRKNGGIAENICLKEGVLGRGIFPLNPSLKSKIHVPPKLLIKKEDIILERNKLRIKKDKGYCQEVREFFNFYQDNFSWEGGKESTEFFERGLYLLPSDIKKLIKNYTLLDLEERHSGNWNDVVKTVFLNARGVNFEEKSVIAPIWELVNHEINSFPFLISSNGISTPNYAPRKSELTQVYGYQSSLMRVLQYGFFCKEAVVFSLPFTLICKESSREIICKGLELSEDKLKFKVTSSKIIIDCLPIGSPIKPLLPIRYFEQISKESRLQDLSYDLFRKIILLNKLRRKEILDKLQLIDNLSVEILSKAITYELNSISQL